MKNILAILFLLMIVLPVQAGTLVITASGFSNLPARCPFRLARDCHMARRGVSERIKDLYDQRC